MSFPTGQRQDQAGLVVVRHGQSVANVAFAEAEVSGGDAVDVGLRDADIVLSPLGRQQSSALGRAWRKHVVPEVVCCSPYVRARETWQVAATELTSAAPRAVVDERLRDREMGHFELLAPSTIRRRFPDEARRRTELGEFYYRPPGGESLADVALRLRSFLRDLDLTRRTLIVTHDAVVLMLRYITESLTEDEILRVAPVANASMTSWTVSKGVLRLDAYNDISHLADISTIGVTEPRDISTEMGAAS